MQTGAVAILDALGFKGIWRKTQPDRVLQNLRGVLASVEFTADRISKSVAAKKQTLLDRPKEEDRPYAHLMTSKVWYRAFSDTLVVGCVSETSGATSASDASSLVSDFFALQTVCEAVAITLGFATLTTPPLIYRGAIAVGQYEIQDQFLIGPAVDEAAELEGLADGAFVWLSPSALECFEHVREAATDALPLVLDHSIPLKSGQRYRTHAINPLCYMPSGEFLIAKILSFFDGGGMQVAVKKQHTEAFLKEALVLAQKDTGRQEVAKVIVASMEQQTSAWGRAGLTLS